MKGRAKYWTILFLLTALQPAPAARAAGGDAVADRVIGQVDFSTFSTCFDPAYQMSATSLCYSSGLAVDASGNLYVADYYDGRVLEYDAPARADSAADRVFGRPGFTAAPCDWITISCLSQPWGVGLDPAGNLFVAASLAAIVEEFDGALTNDRIADRIFGGFSIPTGVAVDGAGNLYVSDTWSHRILVYLDPLTTDRLPDRVIGQPDLLARSCNSGGIGSGSLCYPGGLALDAAGNLYVGDGNHRVLVYLSPLATDMVADVVIGQPDFTTAGCNTGGLGASSLCFGHLGHINGVALDAAGNLYVADAGNNRLLVYQSPLATDAVADRVFGVDGLASAACTPPAGVAWGQYCHYNTNAVAVDGEGNLYVSSQGRVLEYDCVAAGRDDADGDGVSDSCDNCPSVANPDQEDLNGDGIGNACDPDADGDGVSDSMDACPSEPPAEGLDADANGCSDTLDGLMGIVRNLDISPLAKNGLLAKLDEAGKGLARGNIRVALAKLHDFINQVEAQRDAAIPGPVADLLVAYAGNLSVLLTS